jgi:thiol-disulfide isomerase/thioredoxin
VRLLIVVAVSLFALLLATACFASPHIIYADATAIKKQIASDHGHIVLVNFWATWCPPCEQEYPSLVEIDRQFRSSGVDVMAVSVDLPEDINGKVKSFVRKQGANFPQFVLNMGDPELAIDTFDKSWQGDLPRTFVYSRSGKLVVTLADEQNYTKFLRAVKKASSAK